MPPSSRTVFFFIDPATTEIYTLSLHDALPISLARVAAGEVDPVGLRSWPAEPQDLRDRKSTRLNSSHRCISYAVFCLKKKKKKNDELKDHKPRHPAEDHITA